MVGVLVMVGSNMRPEQNVPAAVARLSHHPELRLISTSATYVTPAIGADGRASGQADFHNVAVLIETDLTPAELVGRLRAVEADLGRVRSKDKFAPRPIDLDIALFGDSSSDLSSHHLPDPDILRFPHMALPLADVAPDWIHPETGSTLGQIAQAFTLKESEIHRL